MCSLSKVVGEIAALSWKAFYPNDLDNTRKVMEPTYNKGGALLSLKVDTTDYVREVAYKARGQRILIAYGNKIMTRYGYNYSPFGVTRKSFEPNYTGGTSGEVNPLAPDFRWCFDGDGVEANGSGQDATLHNNILIDEQNGS